jgi:hypothetical protein
MLYVTFISIHFVIICDVLAWRTYDTQLALSFKSGCDRSPQVKNRYHRMRRMEDVVM